MDSSPSNKKMQRNGTRSDDMRVITSLDDFFKKVLKKYEFSLESLLIIFNNFNNFQLFYFIFWEILPQ